MEIADFEPERYFARVGVQRRPPAVRQRSRAGAALNNLQVAANLFHHAVEMLAKFRLLRGAPDARLTDEVRKLKRRPYGHDLRTLWSDFKAAVGN
jgi:hypothetical protein